MAGRINKREAAKTISDALALSHFLVANVLVILGEITGMFEFMGEKHGGMAFVRRYIDAPGVTLVGGMWNDANAINLWVSMEAVIISASVVYWLVCWLAARSFLAVSQ